MEALRAESLSKSYGAGATEVRALRDVSLTLARGEVVALVGPSGAGKSTLLLALGLLELPEKGRLWLDGRLVAEDGRAREDLSALRRDKLGFVFQKSNLIPFLTAEENVRIALEIGGGRDKANRERARALLADLEIADRADHYPDQLSGGQQQRVAIARALAASPALLLADEPTAALDSKRSSDVMHLFRRVAREHGAAVVVVTHDHRALDAFDVLYAMEDGALRRTTDTAQGLAAAG
jgi:putative ABC transport system ATP-binding protein